VLFGAGRGRFLLTFDNHNSVNGIREFARARGAEVVYVPVELPDLRVSEERIEAELAARPAGGSSLFAFPAQSNFSSVRHPLAWIAKAKAEGWDVLLDAAAFAPTNALDLSAVKPDFVALSFYKMFGWPTGVGCLLAPVRDQLPAIAREAGIAITLFALSLNARGITISFSNLQCFLLCRLSDAKGGLGCRSFGLGFLLEAGDFDVALFLGFSNADSALCFGFCRCRR